MIVCTKNECENRHGDWMACIIKSLLVRAISQHWWARRSLGTTAAVLAGCLKKKIRTLGNAFYEWMNFSARWNMSRGNAAISLDNASNNVVLISVCHIFTCKV